MSDRVVEEEIARRMGVKEEAIRAARAHPRGLASGLYAQGAIDTERFEALVAEVRETVAKTVAQQRTLPMVCSGCGARWKVRNAHPSKRYGCRKCRKPLVVDLSARSLAGGEEADQTGEARDLPADVLAAMEQPSNLFGKYVLLGEVGRGGMGRVYRGYDTELGRTVALKVMLFQSEEDLARFRQEAFLAAKLDHPGIVQVHEMGEVEGRPYIAMQFVEGKSLESVRLPAPRAAEVVRDAARAIAYAHWNGVIHRDMKPSNLLESKDGRIRVTDFGLAKELGSTSLSGSVVGTPSTMSPEQARGDTKAVGPLSDVYSLGATLYGLLAGDSPYPGANVAEILHQVAYSDPVSLRRRVKVPGELETIVLRAMEKDPGRRYRSASELADDLDRHLQGEPILARRASVFYRVRKTVAKRWAAVAIGVLGLAGVIAVVAVLRPRIVEERAAKERERAAKERAETEVHRLRELAGLWTRLALAKHGFHNKTNDVAKVRAKIRDLLVPVSEFILANPTLPQGYYIRARGRLYLDELPAAEGDLRTAIGLQPDFTPGRALLGRVKYEQYQWRLYANAQSRRDAPKQEAALLEEARVELEKGLDAGVRRASIDQWGLIQNEEDEVTRVITRALWTLVVEKRPTHAMNILKEADKKEGAAEYCNWLGLMVGDMKERVTWQTRAIDLMPLWSKPHLDRGWLRNDLGEVDGALEDFNRSIELDPNRSVTWVNRGIVHLKKKDPKLALRDFEAAVRLDPGNAICWWNRALCRRELGDGDGALADINRAVELEPRHVLILQLRIDLYIERRDVQKAAADVDRMMDLRPDLPVSWSGRGIVRSMAGDLKGALADYNRALEIQSDFAEAVINRSTVRQALGDAAGALEDAERGVRLMPGMANAYAIRAGARTQLGNLDGAIADYTECLRLKPGTAPAYFHRGVVRGIKQDLEGARLDFEQAGAAGMNTPELDLNWGRLYVSLAQQDSAKARVHHEAAARYLEKAVKRSSELRDPKMREEAELRLLEVRKSLGR